jgi:hypothetical protein
LKVYLITILCWVLAPFKANALQVVSNTADCKPKTIPFEVVADVPSEVVIEQITKGEGRDKTVSGVYNVRWIHKAPDVICEQVSYPEYNVNFRIFADYFYESRFFSEPGDWKSVTRYSLNGNARPEVKGIENLTGVLTGGGVYQTFEKASSVALPFPAVRTAKLPTGPDNATLKYEYEVLVDASPREFLSGAINETRTRTKLTWNIEELGIKRLVNPMASSIDPSQRLSGSITYLVPVPGPLPIM